MDFSNSFDSRGSYALQQGTTIVVPYETEPVPKD